MAETLSNSICNKKMKSHINDKYEMNCDNNTNKWLQIDRLSSLPDALLVEIISRLPLASAAATSVLSHRWVSLWTLLPHINLNGTNIHPLCRTTRYTPQAFHNFFTTINHILNQITTPHITTFNLRFHHNPLLTEEFQLCTNSLNHWVPFICKRNVMIIQLMLDFNFSGPFVPLPTCIFETHSLVHLELIGDFVCKLPESGLVNLPKLKILRLRLLYEPPVLRTLFRSCPLLETLLLALELDKDEVVEISSSNLKLLTIHMNGPSRGSRIVIDAPNLEEIDINNNVASYCFLEPPSMLHKTSVAFRQSVFGKQRDLSHIPELLRGISSTKSFHLWNNLAIFNTLHHSNASVWLKFRNLIHLSLTVCKEHVNWDTPIPLCLLTKLKSIEVLEIKGDDVDVKLVKYILSNANVLEKLYIVCYADYDADYDKGEICQLWKEYAFCRTLFKLKRSSLACKIEFEGSYIDASTDGSQNGSISCRIDWFGPDMWQPFEEDDE